MIVNPHTREIDAAPGLLLPAASSYVKKMAERGLILIHAASKSFPSGREVSAGVQAMTTRGGQIHVAASCLDNNGSGVLLHEAFHARVEALIGSDRWKELLLSLGRIFLQFENGNRESGGVFGAAFKRVVDASSAGFVSPGTEIEEFGAYAVEEFEGQSKSFSHRVTATAGLIKASITCFLGVEVEAVTPQYLAGLSKLSMRRSLVCPGKSIQATERFSFVGVNAADVDLGGVILAKEMASQGVDAEVIRCRTGWHAGPDEMWRFEISDHGALPKLVGTFGEVVLKVSESKVEKVLVSDILEHEELFAAYPCLAQLEVKVREEGAGLGGAIRGGECIEVSSELPSDAWVSVVVHELQHKIQQIESYAQGSDADEISRVVSTLNRQADVLATHPQILVAEEWMVQQEQVHRIFDDDLPEEQLMQALRAIRLQACERYRFYGLWQQACEELLKVSPAENGDSVYHRLAGEVEARNVQHRLKMNVEERRKVHPMHTADVSPDSMIINLRALPDNDLFKENIVDSGRSAVKALNSKSAAEVAIKYMNNELQGLEKSDMRIKPRP